MLTGLRVIKLIQNMAGPCCTEILGDLGTEIIKIERPAGGDDTRTLQPPALGAHSSTFLVLNRNKSSVCIDINTEGGASSLTASKQLPRRMGSAMSMTAPHDLFQAKDGSVIVAASNDRPFSRVGKRLALPMMAEDLTVKIDGTRGVPFEQSPTLGADTDRLLTALGCDSSRLCGLRECDPIRHETTCDQI